MKTRALCTTLLGALAACGGLVELGDHDYGSGGNGGTPTGSSTKSDDGGALVQPDTGITTGPDCVPGLQCGSPWPMRGHDPARTWRTSALGPASAPVRKWSVNADLSNSKDHDEQKNATVIAADGTIYVPRRNELVAVDTAGSRKWGIPQCGSSAPMILADGSLVADCDSGQLMRIATNGMTMWSAPCEGPASIAPDGTIYCLAPGKTGLRAIDLNGTTKWTAPAQVGGGIRAVGPDGTAYVDTMRGPDEGGQVTAFAPNGSPRWTFVDQTSGVVDVSVAADGTIYMVSNVLYAVMPDRTLKWRWEPPDGQQLWGGPLALGADGTLYLYNGPIALDGTWGGGTLRILSPEGKLLRTVAADCPPGAIDGVGAIYCVHDTSYSAVLPRTSTLTALGADGTAKWAVSAADGSSFLDVPILGTGGTVFVGLEGMVLSYAP